jgi:hypothetical protein
MIRKIQLIMDATNSKRNTVEVLEVSDDEMETGGAGEFTKIKNNKNFDTCTVTASKYYIWSVYMGLHAFINMLLLLLLVLLFK